MLTARTGCLFARATTQQKFPGEFQVWQGSLPSKDGLNKSPLRLRGRGQMLTA